MSNRNENSLQTAARWGRNVIVGAGVLYFLFKLVTAWVEVWYHLFPGVRRRMEKRYGREEAHIRFVSQGVGWLVASPIAAFLVLALVAFADDQFNLGFASRWDKFWAEASGGEILFWIVFVLALPFVVGAVVVMLGGIISSIGSDGDKRQARPPVSRFTLWLCFYLLAVPTALLMVLLDSGYGGWAMTLLVLTGFWHLLRRAIRRAATSTCSSETASTLEPALPATTKKRTNSASQPKGRKTPRNTIFGYVEEFTKDYGHGHPLPKNDDPLREWMASMWESKMEDELARKGIFVEMPRLSSKANASRCRRILAEHGVPASSEFLDDILEMRTKYSAEDVAMHLGGLLNRHGAAVLVCVVEGEVSVFTRELGARFPAGFLTKCRDMIGITPETPVAWYRAMDAQPVETVAAVALYGRPVQQSEFPTFTGRKLQILRQRFLSSDCSAAPSEPEASYQI